MIKVIAEIGWNHCGDMNLAKEMILAAKESGATYAKFQSWSVSKLKAGDWDSDGRREIYEKAELTKERHIELIDYCNKVGIKFLSSVFSIRFCDDNFDVVFMSTGTSTIEEVAESVKDLRYARFESNTEQLRASSKSQFYLLHCVSTYPCDPSMANMLRMNSLKMLGWPIGYSDHIQGVESAKVAIGEGAEVIEKHFTTDNDLPGRDNKFAILPHEMKDLTDYIAIRDEMFISHGTGYQSSESDSRTNYAGRFDA